MVTGDHQELQREMVKRETEPLCQTGQSDLPELWVLNSKAVSLWYLYILKNKIVVA